MTNRKGILLLSTILAAGLVCGCIDEPGFVDEGRDGLTFEVTTAKWQGGIFAQTKAPNPEEIPYHLTDITDESGEEVLYMLESMEGMPVHTERTLGGNADVPADAEVATKATEKTSWTDGEQFALRAYASGNDYTGEFDYFGETKRATLDASATPDKWTLAENLYWPTSRNLVKFYAWWPYDPTDVNPAYNSNDKILTYTTPTDPTQQQDLLYATTNQLNVIGSQGVVPIEFKHALTAVVFKGADAELNLAIKHIELQNVWTTGEFNLDSQSWMVDKSNPANMGNISFDAYHMYRGDLPEATRGWYYSNDSGTSWTLEEDATERQSPVLNDNGNLMMLIPQDMVDADGTTKRRVVFTLMDNSTVEVDLPQSPAWTPGSTIIYTLHKGGILVTVSIGSSTSSSNVPHPVVATSNGMVCSVWRYKNMPPDGDHQYGWFTKVRAKFKLTYCYKYDVSPNVVIYPTDEPLPLEDTYGIKIGLSEGQSYEDRPNIWKVTSDDAIPSATGYSYTFYVGYPTPIVKNRYSTKEIIDEAIQGRAALGSSTGYYDLSATATANCYIVEAPGYYKFKAVKGNDATDTEHLADALNLSGTTISYIEDNTGKIIDGDCTYEGGYIKFKTKDGTNLEQGNVIITATDGSGNTLWQWHIWVTDSANWHPEEERTIHSKVGSTTTNFTFHPVSLGLCYRGYYEQYENHSMAARFVVTDDDFNPLTGRWAKYFYLLAYWQPNSIEEGYYYASYKWGDAVPSSLKGFDGSKYSGTTTPLFPVPSFSNTTPVQHTLSTTTWNANATNAGPYAATYGVTKTIYDPSPAGWHVPPPQATNNISTSGYTVGNVHSYAIPRAGTSTDDLHVFPQHQDGSAITGGIAFWSKTGWYYWSGGTPDSGTVSNAYGSYNTGSSTWGPQSISKSTQGLVRPVKDDL